MHYKENADRSPGLSARKNRLQIARSKGPLKKDIPSGVHTAPV